MIKNLVDVCIGTVGWYLMGWSFAYGGDTLTKTDGVMTGPFDECDMDENPMGCGDGYADNGFIGGKIMMAGSGFLGKGENSTKDCPMSDTENTMGCGDGYADNGFI